MPLQSHCCLSMPALQEREAVLAGLLRQRLQPFLAGQGDGFSAAVRKEADELAALPFGIAMLHCIGCGPPLCTCQLQAPRLLGCAQLRRAAPSQLPRLCRVPVICSHAAHSLRARHTKASRTRVLETSQTLGPLLRRYCYERAAHIVLGATWSEWFTRKTHQWGTSMSAVASKACPPVSPPSYPPPPLPCCT